MGCGPSALFEQSFEFENHVWSYGNEKSFSFLAPDTTSTFDLILDLTHTENYTYENLYIQLTTHFPNQEQVSDEISIPLIQEDGHWVGKGSTEKRVRVFLQQSLRFNQVGEHTITIAQHSREENLEEISSVSLSIYPLEK